MKHVVIGGAGFTGRYLVQDLIRDGHPVMVCDIRGEDEATGAEFFPLDITDSDACRQLPLGPDDIVYHLAARQYHLPVPRLKRQHFFDEVNVRGTENLLEAMKENGCKRMVYFSTDMVYGTPSKVPVGHDHARDPNGEYGQSKKSSEDLIFRYREQGMRVTVFRPRLIIGPGRLGVLTKLFSAIAKNRPVPLIGDGSNCYQMISVFDCVSAIRCAVEHDVPNGEFNLGSAEPPSVYELLHQLIQSKGSNSRLVKTPAGLVKSVLTLLDTIGLTVLYREQYAIANVNYLLDIEQTKRVLSWRPDHTDTQMINAAFDEYMKLRG